MVLNTKNIHLKKITQTTIGCSLQHKIKTSINVKKRKNVKFLKIFLNDIEAYAVLSRPD